MLRQSRRVFTSDSETSAAESVGSRKRHQKIYHVYLGELRNILLGRGQVSELVRYTNIL